MPYGVRWKYLQTGDLLDPRIQSFVVNPTVVLAGTGVFNPSFTASYNFSPSGANIQAVGSGTKSLVTPFTGYTWSTGTFQNNTPGATQTFYLTASGALGIAVATGYLTWKNKAFWGVSATGTYNTAFINALSTGYFALENNASFSLSPSAGQYIWYAFRTAAGTPFFFDTDSHILGGFVKQTTVAYVNDAGLSENYDLYRSDNPALGFTNINVYPSSIIGPVTNNITYSITYSSGNSGSASYVHTQTPAATSWVITHGLNMYPNITALNTSGYQTFGQIIYNSTSQVTLNFNVPVDGTAYLS